MKQGSVSSDEEIECLKSVWIHEQCEIREKIVEIDTCTGLTEGGWRYIGGLDISFIVGDDINAAACYVVIDREYLAAIIRDYIAKRWCINYLPRKLVDARI